MANKHMKKYPTSFITDMQIKMPIKDHYTPIRMAKKKLLIPHAGKDVQQLDFS